VVGLPEVAYIERDEDAGGLPPRASDRADADFLSGLVVLPAQLDGLRGAPPSGVKALLVALLEEAIACLFAGIRTENTQSRAEAVRAERWIRSRDTSFAFAFESVCDVLDLDAEALRQQVLRQSASTVKKPARARRRHEVPRGDRRLEYLPAPRAARTRGPRS
jgi:hypothetical protein